MSVETIYATLGGKVPLLIAAIEGAVVGDDEPVPLRADAPVRGKHGPNSVIRARARQRRWLSNQLRVRCQASAAVSGSSSKRWPLLG